MSKKCLVTGGSGYLGTRFVTKLLTLGHSVRVFDISHPLDNLKEVEFIQGDIRDLQKVVSATIDMQWVFHNVAQVPLAKDAALFCSVNREGTKNLLQAALKNQAQRVIYTSSSAVFGVPKQNPVLSDTQPKPREAYGEAKYEGELLCHAYEKMGLPITILRPRTILGHGRLGIFQMLFEWIFEGTNVPVLGSGNNLYQFIHADDFVDACFHSAQREKSGVYNCGTDRFGTMREALESLCQYAKTGSQVKSVPNTLAVLGMNITSALGLSPLGAYHSLMYGKSMYFDISKTVNDLDWHPKYSNNEMFIESYKWYLANREVILKSRGPSHHRSGVKQGILKILKHLL